VALLATVAYVIGIPALLSVELRASPLRQVFRVVARATHSTLLNADAHPALVRPIFRLCAVVVAGLLALIMLVYAVVAQALLAAAGAFEEAARAVLSCATAGPTAALEASRARVHARVAVIRKTLSSRSELFAGVRRACGVPRGPFAAPDLPDAAELPPTSFVARALGRDFRPACWYWELWILCRKLLMLLPQLFSSAHVEFEAICVVIVVIGALAAQAVFAPYKSDALNSLEFVSLSCSCLVILCALLFKSGSFPSSNAVNAEAVVGAVCVVLIVGFVAVFGIMTAVTFCELGGATQRLLLQHVVFSVASSGGLCVSGVCARAVCVCVTL
jgi:hypothetical protein